MISRQLYEKWAEEGRKDLGMRATDRIKEILENHVSEPINKGVAGTLKEIVQTRDSEN